MTEKQEKLVDQRSIEFARFRNQVVLQITGNYFASYSADLMKKEDRARQTVVDVMVPILKAAAPLAQEEGFQSFALEISHHVRKKTLGVTGERAENVVLTLPRDAVTRLVSASGTEEQGLVLREAMVLLDGQPVSLWGSELSESAASSSPAPSPAPPPAKPVAAPATLRPSPVASALPAAPTSARDTSQDALKSLQSKYPGNT